MEQILYWLVGGLGVPLVNGLKELFAIEGKGAVWLTAGVAALLAALAVGITGAANWTSFTPEEVFAAFGQVLAAATLAYKLMAKPTAG
jgi:hypothetical protein